MAGRRFGQPRHLWLSFAAATGFYTALVAWGFARVRRLGGARWPFAVALWFCALEFLNPQLFAYLQGVGWYQHPRFFLLAALTGVSGVSFIVIACNAIVLQGVEAFTSNERSQRRAWAINAGVLVGLFALAIGYSSVRLQRIEAAERATAPLRMALIQPDHTIARRERMFAEGLDSFARDLVELSREANTRATDVLGAPLDVYVWPEGGLRADPSQPFNREALEFVRESGAEVWTGANHHEARAGGIAVSHNSAFRLYGDGLIDVRYDKNILVPFGEYVPFRDVIPGFDRIPTIGEFEAGDAVPVYRSASTRFVFLICYEVIRSAFVRRALATDAATNLIVNVTVDAWYGDSSEQSQHLMLAAVQSAINGLPLARATTTGISAFVDARGVITAQTGKFTREVLVGELRPVRVESLYGRAGDWFAWLCVLGAAVLLLASFAREPRSGAAIRTRKRGG
jgi:apolipoprotein N-acyltransferase